MLSLVTISCGNWYMGAYYTIVFFVLFLLCFFPSFKKMILNLFLLFYLLLPLFVWNLDFFPSFSTFFFFLEV